MLRGLRIALHPDDGQPITLETGKYGPYLKHGTTYAALPKASPLYDSTSPVILHRTLQCSTDSWRRQLRLCGCKQGGGPCKE